MPGGVAVSYNAIFVASLCVLMLISHVVSISLVIARFAPYIIAAGGFIVVVVIMVRTARGSTRTSVAEEGSDGDS